MRHFWCVGTRSRCGSTDVLSGLRALQHRGRNRRESPWATTARLWFAKTWDCSTRVLQRRPVDALRSAGRGPRALWHRRRQELGSLAAASPTINSVIIALAHNGTLVNTDELRRRLIELGVPFLSNSDSEVATKLIGYFTQRTGHLREGHSQDHGARARRLRHDAHQRAGALRIPRSARHSPARAGQAGGRGVWTRADAASVSQLPSQDGATTVDSAVHVTRAGGWVVASRPAHSTSWVPSTSVTSVPARSCASAPRGLVSEQGVPAAERARKLHL